MNKKEAKDIAIQLRYILFSEEIGDFQTEMAINFMMELLHKCEQSLGRKVTPEEYEHSELGRRLK